MERGTIRPQDIERYEESRSDATRGFIEGGATGVNDPNADKERLEITEEQLETLSADDRSIPDKEGKVSSENWEAYRELSRLHSDIAFADWKKSPIYNSPEIHAVTDEIVRAWRTIMFDMEKGLAQEFNNELLAEKLRQSKEVLLSLQKKLFPG